MRQFKTSSTISRQALVKTQVQTLILEPQYWNLVFLSSGRYLGHCSQFLFQVFFSDGPLLLCRNKQARKVTVLIWRAVQGLETFVPHIQVSALTHWPFLDHCLIFL